MKNVFERSSKFVADLPSAVDAYFALHPKTFWFAAAVLVGAFLLSSRC